LGLEANLEARLIFSDQNKNVAVQVADRDFVTLAYDQLDKFSYEFSEKHRVTQGAVVMVASLRAGAIVMLTKPKSDWLYIDYHEQSVPKSVVLRMDKNDYKKILEAVKTHTVVPLPTLWPFNGAGIGFPQKSRKAEARCVAKSALGENAQRNGGQPAGRPSRSCRKG